MSSSYSTRFHSFILFDNSSNLYAAVNKTVSPTPIFPSSHFVPTTTRLCSLSSSSFSYVLFAYSLLPMSTLHRNDRSPSAGVSESSSPDFTSHTPRSSSNKQQQVRHRASVACASCRERRIRCVVPEGESGCTQCKKTGAECIIRNDDERRRCVFIMIPYQDRPCETAII